MAGRKKSEQGPEKREQRTVVRWTSSEKKRLAKAKESMGVPYDVDVVRILTLQGLDSLLGKEPENVAE
jgi:hypothetical protein